jgi:hypothetical protein
MLPPPPLLRSARQQLFLHRPSSLLWRTCYLQLWPRYVQMLPPPSLLRSARQHHFVHRSLLRLWRASYIRTAGAPLGSAVTSHYRHTRAMPFRGAQWSSRARLHRLHPRLGQARPAISRRPPGYLAGPSVHRHLLSTRQVTPAAHSAVSVRSSIQHHGTLLLPRCPSHQLQLG